MRPLSAQSYRTLALMGFALLGPELYVGLSLWFAPGWANGWPGGLTMDRVWSVGMTTCLFALMTSVGVGVAGLIGLVLSRRRPTHRAGCAAVAWLVSWTLLAVVASGSVYRAILASAADMWPGGYPGRP